jgi:hypothetical protein
MMNDAELRKMLDDPALSDWFKRSLLSSLDRDPVDAARDAYLLSSVLDQRAQAVMSSTLASLAIRDARAR